jgi:hypothetical protein
MSIILFFSRYGNAILYYEMVFVTAVVAFTAALFWDDIPHPGRRRGGG